MIATSRRFAERDSEELVCSCFFLQFKKNSRQLKPTRKLLRFALYASCELIRYVDEFMAIVLLFKEATFGNFRALEKRKRWTTAWKVKPRQSNTCARKGNKNEIEKAHLTIFPLNHNKREIILNRHNKILIINETCSSNHAKIVCCENIPSR